VTNRLLRHTATRVLGICAVVGAGALAIDHYLHTPRNAPANQSQPNEPVVVLMETGVRIGSKVTTTDGVCTIQVKRITGTLARLTVTTRIGDTYHFDKAVAGRRLVVPTPTALYYVDLLRIRGNRVDVAVSKEG
jgi:hypothetical protein